MCKRKEKDTSIDCSGLSAPVLSFALLILKQSPLGAMHIFPRLALVTSTGYEPSSVHRFIPHCRMVMPETFVIFHNSDDTVRFLCFYCDKIPALTCKRHLAQPNTKEIFFLPYRFSQFLFSFD